MRYVILIAALLIHLPLNAQSIGSITDARDGHTYAIVTYAITPVDTVLTDHDEYRTFSTKAPATYEFTLSSNMPPAITWMAEDLRYNMDGSYCHDEVNPHDESTSNSCDPSRGRLYTWQAAMEACPAGWHLSSDDEWFLLASQYGGVKEAGTHMKSTALRGSNQSKFNALRGNRNIFWSSDEKDAETAWDWKVLGSWTKLQRWPGQKIARNAVRCVKDTP